MKILYDLFVWNIWWFSVGIISVIHMTGHFLFPLYANVFQYIDVDVKIKRWKSRKKNNFPTIHIFAGKLCLYSNVCNVYAQHMVYLPRKHHDYSSTYALRLHKYIDDIRESIGFQPPKGWPLKFIFAIAMMSVFTIHFATAYRNLLKTNKKNIQCYKTSQNSKDAELFDSDADTVMIDNAANCIVWKSRNAFLDTTYTSLERFQTPMIDTAAGAGNPTGIGQVPISWFDDNGIQHKFILNDVYHIPDSPVNILGISAFSKILGDYEAKGTRINSSSLDSIFTWDHGKFQRTFANSNANMPELEVNGGYSKFHRFCNFVDKIQPIKKQCYHVQCNKIKDLQLYDVGEEVLYKNNDHLEKGVIEKVTVNKEKHKQKQYHVRFRDNRHVIASFDNLQAQNETDVATVPITNEDYANEVKCLTQHELHLLRNPLPLSQLEKEWKITHDRMGHLPYAMMDRLVENNILPSKFKKMKGKSILCPSCVFGRMKRRAWRNKSPTSWNKIRKKSDSPGSKVSTDQLVVAQPGLVPRISGKHTSARISGATGFIDHFSGYSYSALQTSLDGDQTLAAKNNFETHANTFGIKIKSYRADNGRFAEKSFLDAVKQGQQSIDFCAVGAHHQNGVIERHFQTLSSKARTLLLHAKRHWPTMITVVLWPFAYKYAELLYNNFHVDEEGYSPIQKFSGQVEQIPLPDIHTWGCPCYVLDSNLQNKSMLAKWEPRSRLGVYLGHSPCHAGSVALVLDPKTLHVSPQFHVVINDNFSTVPFLASNDVPSNWRDLVEAAEHSTDEDFDLAKMWVDSQLEEVPILTDKEGDSEEVSNAKMVSFEQDAKINNLEVSNPEGDKNINVLIQPTLPDLNELTRRKTARTPKPTFKVRDSSDKKYQRMFGLATKIPVLIENAQFKVLAFVTHLENIQTLFDDTINECHHYALNATSATNDVYTLKQMLQLDNIQEFITAMIKEVDDHESRDHWEVVQRTSMPKGAKTILSVWAFKRKRLPDGTILKHKARLNAHGGMHRWGIDYWETYAPVVNWISVRLLMVLAIIHKLDTKSIDFVLAFPQADLDRDVFMELPYGFQLGEDRRRYVLKLKKNLYGLCDASYNWFQKITEGLEAEGFRRSDIDQCVFLRKDCIILLYVDDMIALARNKEVLETLVVNLQKRNYILTDEGSLDKYLGVDVKYKDKGQIELVQPFLIQRIIDLLGLEKDSTHSPRPTPATKPLLHKDLLGEKRKNTWNYRQAVGMLTYLQATSRPDISMAVHQCARYSICPMLTHERAIKRIGRYLLGTKDKGILFKPDIDKGMECFVDADFAGGWSKDSPEEPDNVLSRTGFVIFYAGCPLAWASRMQTEISFDRRIRVHRVLDGDARCSQPDGDDERDRCSVPYQ